MDTTVHAQLSTSASYSDDDRPLTLHDRMRIPYPLDAPPPPEYRARARNVERRMIGLGHLPSIENLQCFIAAAEQLNFRRAAEQMALTPTAFGQRIKQLEEQLGHDLFVRTTRHVELTPTGHRLLPVARDAVATTRQCAEVVHHDEALPARFTLGTRFELGMSWVVPAMLALRESHPHWHVDLYFGSGEDILERLRVRQLDCIVTSAPVARREWAAEFLHPEHYVFVGAPTLLADNPFDTVEDARRHRLVDIDESLPLTRYLTSMGAQLQFADVWLTGAGAPIMEVVLRSYGVAVLPRYMCEPHLAAGTLVALLPHLELLEDSFRLLHRADALHAEAFAELAKVLRKRPLS